jgi:hypothetical protein
MMLELKQLLRVTSSTSDGSANSMSTHCIMVRFSYSVKSRGHTLYKAAPCLAVSIT